MKIRIRKSALKDLRRLSKADKKRIHAAIGKLNGFPDVPNCRKLTNFEPAYRMRVGDYRVLFDVVGEEIEIGRILHRRESYRKS